MYSNEDLNDAVDKGIFTKNSVDSFRSFISDGRASSNVDEENFRLISGFNDIFVVIACVLLLASAAWVAHSMHPAAGMGVVAVLSWGLAEFFVLKRKMALPAIVLLVGFVAGVFWFVVLLFERPSEYEFMLAAGIATFSAWLHWKRFKVAITIAAGLIAALGFVLSMVLSLFPEADKYLLLLVFIGGVVSFFFAMKWDSADLKRTTKKSDIAFWLHLLSAPLIIHPIFTSLGVLDQTESVESIVAAVVLYLLLSIVSLVTDRRAFMVSSLVYVLFTLSTLFKTYGFEGDSFAVAGVFIGFSLLLLSGFWHTTRQKILLTLPVFIQSRVPGN